MHVFLVGFQSVLSTIGWIAIWSGVGWFFFVWLYLDPWSFFAGLVFPLFGAIAFIFNDLIPDIEQFVPTAWLLGIGTLILFLSSLLPTT
jgi:hypothetical protein